MRGGGIVTLGHRVLMGRDVGQRRSRYGGGSGIGFTSLLVNVSSTGLSRKPSVTEEDSMTLGSASREG